MRHQLPVITSSRAVRDVSRVGFRFSPSLRYAALGSALVAGAWMAMRSRAADFAGRTVLINGGSRGLGLLLARELAREGTRLVLWARDDVQLEEARRELEAGGAEVMVTACDASIREQVARAVESATARFGKIDCLINCAGIIQVGPLEAMDVSDFERAMNNNFFGYLYPTLEVLPQMQARGAGSIVNIASIGGKIAVPHLLPYTCAKFAVVGFSEGLTAELHKDGINVTTVIPGLMRTGSPANALFKGDQAAEWDWFSVGDSIPMVSMSARRAARRIVRAMKTGRREVVLG